MRVMAMLAGAVLTSVFCLAAFADDDPFLWLEDADGARAVEWARTQSAYTLKALKADPDYGNNFAVAHQILTGPDRIPYGNLAGGKVYNFWQDREHVRGLWRRTSLGEYRSDDPRWDVLLDLDALSSAQNENWVWKGAECLPPAFARCLIMLSRGGDAIAVREFDIPSKSFVKNGFNVSEAKTDVAWVDANTIMIGTNWGQGTLTRAGYPRIVKVLTRGQPIGEARTLFEGQDGDVAVTASVAFETDGRPERFISRGIDFFSTEFFYVDRTWRVMRVPMPPNAEFKGLHKRQLIFSLTSNWRSGGQIYLPGSIVAFSLDDFVATGGALPFIKLLFMPGERNAVEAVVTTRDAVYVSYLENVRGRVRALTFDGANWAPRSVPLPRDGAVEIAASSDFDADVMFKYASFLVPDRLYLLPDRGEPELIKELPERFDAYGFEVRQFEALSKDGVKIPYFIVRKEETLSNGRTPTLLYAYGGFQISTTPWYWSTAGKLWLEKGGAYVVANVRGGGEFGPRWHDAAKGEYRQRNFDDLAAVARSIIARGFTSPRRLGLIGGSQGGLLVTGAFVQNPDMFNAVSAQVPLTDMLRYTHMSAGASWIAEYGDPANPRQRAIIARWSPYQNVKQGVKYPRAFFLAASRDDRVHPGHARKMAARMQSYGQPVYYYEPTNGGHETANTLRDRAEQIALMYTYFDRQLMD